MKKQSLNGLKETSSFIARHTRLLTLTIAAAVSGVMAQMAQASYSVVSYDDTAGTVSFTPENLTAPIVAGVVAAVAAGAVLFVIARGVRWIWRMLSTR